MSLGDKIAIGYTMVVYDIMGLLAAILLSPVSVLYNLYVRVTKDDLAYEQWKTNFYDTLRNAHKGGRL